MENRHTANTLRRREPPFHLLPRGPGAREVFLRRSVPPPVEDEWPFVTNLLDRRHRRRPVDVAVHRQTRRQEMLGDDLDRLDQIALAIRPREIEGNADRMLDFVLDHV